ncbi:MAG: hypothetical protein AUF79_07945 [Crenarchaeota archaeon 13_1_20CM_2_51_8]|nr:MAG: hypothetical protein AUF79_07945 [Crenarchaeota archaeon 13_1_20CM_2_51_8]
MKLFGIIVYRACRVSSPTSKRADSVEDGFATSSIAMPIPLTNISRNYVFTSGRTAIPGEIM